ncbi:hypothetical protein Y032_0071g592 [Ancylostoma ceylanicum]|uniref:Uncharacterized protein n=1 Tax=Ancylostoma ceylanicum TaxID=53326 RepID=A0A016TY86_9BILA|nr:hypothetical protein Y032_0071g592 [Ancylostoma ceylanicum]
MGRILKAIIDKIPFQAIEKIEEDKRSRSFVLAGVEEAPSNLQASQRQKHLKDKVFGILDALDIECRPTEIRRMGRPDPNRTRLIKVVFPSKHEWSTALSRAHLLRSAGFGEVYIRRSMRDVERKREYELRQLARERNRQVGSKEWVVYKWELKRTAELNPHPKSGNSH